MPATATASVLPMTARVKDYTPNVRVVTLTPAVATEILNRNILNRPLRSGHVEKLARDMAAGKWRMNAETIKIARGGAVLDGQHRLYAVIESGASIQAMLVEGLDEDVMPTIDTGIPRSFGDVISIRGGKNTTLTSSVVRLIKWYTTSPRPGSVPTYTHSEMDEALGQHRDIPERVSEITNAQAHKRKIAPGSVLGLVYTLAYRVDPDQAKQWLTLLGSGAGLDADHPVLQFRERMLKNRESKAKLRQEDVAALCIKSWNQFITGHRTNVLTWRTTEPFPEIASRETKPARRHQKAQKK